MAELAENRPTMISLQNFQVKVYLRGHYNVAVTFLLQVKREVWLNSNNAFLHTSKWNKCVSHQQGLLKRLNFTSKIIHCLTGLGGLISYCKMFLLLRKGTCRLSLCGEMEEAEAEPCRRSQHDLIIFLHPEGKRSPRWLLAPPFALYQTQLCAPGEAENLKACNSNSCWSLWGFISNP